jgi:hypothetical protein
LSSGNREPAWPWPASDSSWPIKQALIASAQRRIDEVIRELDRHRLIRVQLNKFSAANEATKAAAPKMITGKVMDKKVA